MASSQLLALVAGVCAAVATVWFDYIFAGWHKEVGDYGDVDLAVGSVSDAAGLLVWLVVPLFGWLVGTGLLLRAFGWWLILGLPFAAWSPFGRLRAGQSLALGWPRAAALVAAGLAGLALLVVDV